MAFNSFTEFYVTKSGDASATNGGSSTGAPIVVDDVDAVHDGAGVHTLTDQGTDGFAGVAKDDFLCWDYEGAAELARVNSVTSDDVIVVQNMVGAVQFTALTEKKVKVKGPWDTCYAATQAITTSFVNDDGDPPRVNIGPGTYAAVDDGEFEIISGGTVACPLTFEGYYATAGDECDNSGTFTPPIIDGGAGASNNGTIYAAGGIDYLRIRNLKILAETNGKDAIHVNADYSVFDRLWVKATGTTADGIKMLGTANTIRDCYVESATDYAINGFSFCMIVGCYVRACDNIGITFSNYSTVSQCIVESTVNDCILFNGHASVVDGCVLYHSTSGSGVKINGAIRNVVITNIIFDDLNQYAIEGSASTFITEANNAIRTDSMGVSARDANILSDPIGEVNHTADPFTSAAGHDFSLNSAAGGGALLKATGFPGTMLDGTNVGYADIGALQSEAAAGGGCGKLVGPGGGLVG